MLMKEDIKNIINQLEHGHPYKLALDGTDVLARYVDNQSKLSLTTQVYQGDQYIPLSVRKCVLHSARTHFSPIRTFLTVDEHQFTVSLHFLGHTDHLEKEELQLMLEEFGHIADQWRVKLDENDRNDLVYIHV